MPFPNVFYSSEMENLKKLYPDYLERTFENNQVALFPTIPALQYDNGMFRYEFVDITEKEVVNFERFVQIRDHEIDTHPVMGYALLYISLDLPNGTGTQKYRFGGSGAFNAVYFPCDDQNNFLEKPVGEYVLKIPFSQDEITDKPERTTRLFNDRYHKYQQVGLIKKAEICKIDGRQACLIPFLSIVAGKVTESEKMDEMLHLYQEHERVLLDALVDGNVVKMDIGNQSIVGTIDFGNAIKFLRPSDPGNSQTSLEIIPLEIKLYSPFLKKQSEPQGSAVKLALFTQALFVVAALQLKLKDLKLLTTNQNLVNLLSNIFQAKAENVIISEEFLQFFDNESPKTLEKVNAHIVKLTKIFDAPSPLSLQEIRYLRFNPAVFDYEEPLIRLSYLLSCLPPNLFYRSARFREQILANYLLTNDKFFHIFTRLILDKQFEIKDFKSFDRAYILEYAKTECSTKFFDAFMLLVEKSKTEEDPYYAYRALKNLCEEDAYCLAQGYEFGLRDKHLERLLENNDCLENNDPTYREKIIKLLSDGENLEKVICTFEKSSPLNDKTQTALFSSQSAFLPPPSPNTPKTATTKTPPGPTFTNRPSVDDL